MPEEQIQYLPLDRIDCCPQVRKTFDEESLVGLAHTMKEIGQLQPIRVRREGNRFVIVDGERRFRAKKKGGGSVIGAVIEERELCESEVILRQMVANCQREELKPMEKARAIARLMQETQWSATQIAVRLGSSNATISRLLALLTLPNSIQEGVASGSIPASSAYELARVEDARQQAELAGQVVAGQLSRDALSGTMKRAGRQGNKQPKISELVRVTAKLGNRRSVTIIGPSLNLNSLVTWLQELLARAQEAVSRNAELSEFAQLLKDQAKA